VGQVGRGWWGEMKLKVSSDPADAENIKKEPKALYFGCFFKLPDCSSNNTYGDLRFNVFYLELCQFVGRGQLGKALAILLRQVHCIHLLLNFANNIHSNSLTNTLEVICERII